jgi:hypothetical protein
MTQGSSDVKFRAGTPLFHLKGSTSVAQTSTTTTISNPVKEGSDL